MVQLVALTGRHRPRCTVLRSRPQLHEKLLTAGVLAPIERLTPDAV